MRVHVRTSLLATVVALAVLVAAPAAHAAFGIEKFVAVNCVKEDCAETKVGPFSEPKEPTKEEAEEQGFTQAGGRVPFGITHFKVKTVGPIGEETPEGGPVTHIRTDVAPGLATNPSAVEQCSKAAFGEIETAPGSGIFLPPACPEKVAGKPGSIIGTNKVTVFVELVGKDVPLEGTVYNLVPDEGHASEFGVALNLEPLVKAKVFAHTFIKGNVEWGKGSALDPAHLNSGTLQGDYHDYFEIEVSPTFPLISSRLVFFGNKNENGEADDFITNATRCPGNLTTTLRLENAEKASDVKPYTTPVGLKNCNLVPFEPGFSLLPAAPGPDQPDGFTTNVEVHHESSSEIDNSEVKTINVALPEGMTLNPSAAAGLTACTPAQARIHSSTAGVACPASSELGTVSLEVPTLPPGSLTGKLYLGGPESGPITSPPFTMYLDAESARYGVSVRLQGEVIPSEVTGQVTTIFNELPEQPFSKATLHFKEDALAPVANPLTCGAIAATTLFTPYSSEGDARAVASAFSFTGCASPIALKPTQSTATGSADAGAKTSFTFNLERPEGNQYLSKVSTVLPPGLVGTIPAVTQCPEPQASLGTCTSASRIGTATVLSGSGPTPYSFSGPVYLTGPYGGAPFGLSIAVPAVAGPFSLGTVITRATINVDQYTGQVTVTSTLPRIFKGIPLRLRRITVAVEKQGFMSNPTSCGPLSTNSLVTGFVPASTESTTASVSSPFQVGNCGALAFKPSFGATANAKTTKVNGTGFETTLKMPAGGANVKSVLVQLPRQLVSRLPTLNKACLAANFETNPFTCPSGSFVGGVRATTPVLPGTLSGPAILVSHGGEAFPDLDLILQGDGVRVILVGHTKITKNITTTNFSTTPDVPVNSVTVSLPAGPHSALTNFGEPPMCGHSLVMPTTITGWNGATYQKNTAIKVTGCGVKIVGRKVVGGTAYLTIQTFAPGRISASGPNLVTTFRRLSRAEKKVTLKVPLRASARGHRPLRIKVRVGFVPKVRSFGSSSASTTLRFP
jgi:hypothetical protein